MEREPRICFVIAHKWIRRNPPLLSYVGHYVDNVSRLYPDALVLIVDNKSKHKDDILGPLHGKPGVVILDNETESGFEVGAYTVACRWLCEDERWKSFDFVVFTQDTFVLKNRYDFSILTRMGVLSCPINGWNGNDMWGEEIQREALTKMGLNDSLNKVNFCWCCSFVASGTKIPQLFSYISKVEIKTKDESCASERWLARVIYELNDHRRHWDIDGNINLNRIKYNEWTVDVIGEVPSYFVKRIQRKTEMTKDCD